MEFMDVNFFCVFTINLLHVFKMSALSIPICIKSCMQDVNGCVNDELFNDAPEV